MFVINLNEFLYALLWMYFFLMASKFKGFLTKMSSLLILKLIELTKNNEKN